MAEIEGIDTHVQYIYNQMAKDYDDLRDLWYSWLFSRLHFFIAKYLLSGWDSSERKVLDVGCGTGFQSFLYAMCGANVTGVDIADELLAVAQAKSTTFRKSLPLELFPAHFPFVHKYNERISAILATRFASSPFISPRFQLGNALDLPFDGNTFDHVNCCGSTLSIVEDHSKALREISRILRTSGTFALELEAKYNADLLWTVLDPLVFGALDYDTPLSEGLTSLSSPYAEHIKVEYPFGDIKDPVYMDLTLFSKRTLLRELERLKLAPVHVLSIHSVTNLIPSTLLDSGAPRRMISRLFTILSRIEESLPFYLPGCSLVIIGRKIG